MHTIAFSMVNNNCIQNFIDRKMDVNSSTVRVFMQLFAPKIVLKVHAQHEQNEITKTPIKYKVYSNVFRMNPSVSI